MDAMAAGKWSRPNKKAEPTRYLFVGNAGEACGLPPHKLDDLLRPLGGLECIKVPSTAKENKKCSHLFAVFTDPAAAQTVKSVLDSENSEDLVGRKFVVDYAQYHPPKTESISLEQEEEVFLNAQDMDIEGLHLIKEFISAEEESKLLLGLEDSGEWNVLARRRVKHFGYEFDYSIRGVHPDQKLGEFPACTHFLTKRLGEVEEVKEQQFDQLTVNEYPVGIGLAPHIDTHSAFLGAILSLSLGSGTIMEFRQGDDHRKLLLPRRSLLIMSGEGRYAWQHYIPHRKTDKVNGAILKREKRTSLTFRTIRKSGNCSCSYSSFCDDQEGELPPTRMLINDQDKAIESTDDVGHFPELEQLHVQDVYDDIATHFSSTRFAIWPEVKKFLSALPQYSLLADVGCGNGKYFDAGKHCCMIGGDLSAGLLQVCKHRGHEVVQLDVVRPPFRKNIFDAVISIAVLHHMSSFERRLAAMKRLIDLLRPGGRALVTVWALEQEETKKMRKWKELDLEDAGDSSNAHKLGKDYLVPWSVPFHRPEASKAARKENTNGKIDELKGTVVFDRFYHVFEKGEIDHLVHHIPNVHIVNTLFDRSNWCIIVEKVQ